MQRFRRAWLTAHRWFALGLGWVLVLSGLTGAMLVVTQPLDRYLHPELFRARSTMPVAAPQASLQQALERLRPQFAPGSTFSFRPALEPGRTTELRVAGPWKGSVYLDPATGQEQGRRASNDGALNLLFSLHSSLWLQSTGKAVLACVALTYTCLLLSGLILWWPRRWPPVWKPEVRKGLLRALFDLHRLGGATLGLLILISVSTGAYMAWRPLGGAINAVSGSTAFKPPPLPEHPADAPTASLDVLAASARQAWPDARLAVLPVPVNPREPLRVRLRTADEPHPYGVSPAWLDPVTGKLLAKRRWSEMDPGSGAVAVIFPLHAGVLGGPLHQLFVALIGLSLAGLGGSGLWLWWRRRKRAPAA